MELDIRIVMHMLTGTKLLTSMQFIMLKGTKIGLPRRLFPMKGRGFETTVSKTNDTIVFKLCGTPNNPLGRDLVALQLFLVSL